MLLVLCDLHKHFYQENIACAYIYYGTKDNPQDHEGVLIGSFYQKPGELVKHLEKFIVPFINEALERKGYTVLNIDFLNQGPHPFLAINRKDKGIIQDHDLAAIKAIITTGINFKNQKSTTSPSVLFTNKQGHHKKDLPQEEVLAYKK